MSKYFKIKTETYKKHPIYSNYAANQSGFIINVNRKIPFKGAINNTGYYHFAIRTEKGIKNYLSHRFIYECYHGVVSGKRDIEHIDNNKLNNRLENLIIK